MTPSRKTSVLITGCSPGGIGYELAVEFLRKGCQVITTARNPDMLRELAAQGFDAVSLEVTSAESIAACRDEVAKLTGGKLDILVNNAGRTHTIPALDIDLDDVRATYETNVFAPMALIQAFITLLIPARGLILNISSISSQVPYLFGAIYSSTKGAIDVYSRALRLELAPLGVRVCVAVTGTVRSNIASRPHRSLPPTSLYQPVADVFQKRLTFSQNNATMPTQQYARRLVADALKGEGWLGGWFGRTPDYFWYGGMSGLVRFATWLPIWAQTAACNVFWKISSMKSRIQASGVLGRS